MEQKQTSEKKPASKRIPRIVFDRPPFDLRRFLVCMGVGLLAGILAGFLLSWVETISCKPVVTADGETVRECDPVTDWGTRFGFSRPLSGWSFFGVMLSVGLIGGAAVGWAWKRGVTPRIEMIDTPVPTRRRRMWRPSSLTALIKV